MYKKATSTFRFNNNNIKEPRDTGAAVTARKVRLLFRKNFEFAAPCENSSRETVDVCAGKKAEGVVRLKKKD